MDDFLHTILELTIPSNIPVCDAYYCAKLARIRDIVKMEIELAAEKEEYTFVDDEIIDGDKNGGLLFRVRERLACWIAP